MISTIVVRPLDPYEEIKLREACRHPYSSYINGILVDAYISACSGIGYLYGSHRFAHAAYVLTSDVQSVTNDGGIWVLTTKSSKYAIATFEREQGRQSLEDYMKVTQSGFLPTPLGRH
jgi:hypothetical protein